MDQYIQANAAFSKFSRNYMELKKGLPIRPSEMGVLNILCQTEGPHIPVMLADLLGVSKPMVTAHLTSLSEKGYILKEQSTEDKRAYYILPTQKAQELVNATKVDINRLLSRLAGEMGHDEFLTLVRLAEKANKILQKELSHAE